MERITRRRSFKNLYSIIHQCIVSRSVTTFCHVKDCIRTNRLSMQVWKFQPQLDSKKHLDVSGLLHVPVRSQEWEGKEKAHHAPPANTKWHELSLHWEWQVRVSALLRGSVDIAQQHSGGGLEVSGGSGGSQSDSGNHDVCG